MAFWGLVLEPKRNYTQQEVEQPFHISMATLDLQASDSGEQPVTVVCRKRDSEFILCNLSKKHGVYNAPLNLDFELGGGVDFHVLGNGTVHLTGNLIEDMESFGDSDESEDEEESDVILKNTKKQLEAAVNKRKPESVPQNNSKKVKLDELAEEEEDDSDFDMDDSDDGEEEGAEEEEEDDDDDDDDEDEEQPAAPQRKDKPKQHPQQQKQQQQLQQQQQRQQQQQKKQQQQANTSKTDNKQGKNQPKGQTPQHNKKANGTQPQSNGVSRVINGVQVQDIVEGSGQVAKRGRSVSVYYVGRLKSNNQKFDSTTDGPGFQFRLGRSEVIKGWDVGVEGMKVGGKRRLTIPAKMAYGERGAGSAVPPNATLVFEVELKKVQ